MKLRLSAIKTGCASAGAAIAATAIVIAPFAMTARLDQTLRYYNKQVAAMVVKYRSCPDSYRTDCMCKKDAGELLARAKNAETNGAFGTAGFAYVRVGNENAKRMSDSCRAHGWNGTADSILVEMGIRQEAAATLNQADSSAKALAGTRE